MKRIYLSLIMVQFALVSFAAEPLRLSLDECRSMALESSQSIRSSGERVESSRDMLAAYRTNRLPALSLSGNYLYSSMNFTETLAGGMLPVVSAAGEPQGTFAYMPDQDFEVEFGSMYNVGARVVQPIYMGGKVSSAIKLAQHGVAVSEADKARAEAQLLVSTDEAFYSVKRVEEMLLSAERYREVVEELYRQCSSSVSSGMGRQNDLLKVEVKLNEAKLMCQKGASGLRLARMNLCYTIGLPLSTSALELYDEFDMEQQIDSDDMDITQRPEYAMLENQIAVRELEARISKSEFLPSVSALASYGYANGATLNGAPLVNGASIGAGVMVSVPIFHWGKGRKTNSANARQVEIARNELEDKSQQMSLELMSAINDYEDAALQISLAASSLLAAEENMRVSKNQYNAGMETMAGYLEAQALWQQAMASQVDARAARRVAYSRYLRAAGR